MTDDMDEPGRVRRPHKDQRVRDVDRFLHDKRTEALAMIRLWEKSRAIDAREQLAYWTGVLREVDRQAAMLADGAG